MTENTGLFNRRFAANFIPLPPLQVPAVGSTAPDFSLPRIGSEDNVKLSDYQSKQPVVLAFTRIFTEKLFCPFCYPHIQDLKTGYQKIRDKGAELLMISSTDLVQSQQVVEQLSLPYPFLFDPDCHTFRRYGVGQALGAPLPAQFVINSEGRITFRHLFSFVDSNAELDTILAELDKLAK
ncbi:alkyl hydroperoxide reductase/ Thiol specific antioxidant/ Mal allergen [Stanieria cyanosphaera PCC 7437]|uniref:Alkyl hydroperoxide reductase/ Thiol specific antioxidant/ Mal allergen n=1 Tax=Stanieria cyanosphaera (strain ATCC 29371 / PCC 7437) TaxID=111780 RepID=K9XSL7_STAC7|nr:peroxiredoxin family protein [Stanieria cyanosphaera]AFZ35059.1 alkyl hydroperoxide reductase/ Thiol specific antioxidant/ Mal allergen [Stanieria cyanosphaera PCC 7437]